MWSPGGFRARTGGVAGGPRSGHVLAATGCAAPRRPHTDARSPAWPVGTTPTRARCGTSRRSRAGRTAEGAADVLILKPMVAAPAAPGGLRGAEGLAGTASVDEQGRAAARPTHVEHQHPGHGRHFKDVVDASSRTIGPDTFKDGDPARDRAGLNYRAAVHSGDVEELIDRYRGGETVAELARAADLSEAVVARRLRKAGVTMRRPGRRRAPVPDELLLARYATGLTLEEIAGEVGLSSRTVSRRLKATGVQVRYRRNRPAHGPAYPVQEWVARYRDGESVTAIAALSRVGCSTVYRHLARAGMPLRRHRETERLVARYADGLTLTDLAAESALDRRTVARRLRAADVHVRYRRTRPAPGPDRSTQEQAAPGRAEASVAAAAAHARLGHDTEASLSRPEAATRAGRPSPAGPASEAGGSGCRSDCL